jgi:hypothetical protein
VSLTLVGLVGLALALGVAVVVVVAVVAERYARGRGLVRVADRLTDEFGTARPVTLDVPERPLLPALLRGRATARMSATDVPVGDGAQLERLDSEVDTLELSIRRRTLRTGPTRFVARIEERELARVVDLPTVVSRLELRAEGLRVWTVLGLPLDAEVLVTDGGLRIVPDPAQLAAAAQLPGLSALRRAIDGLGLQLPLPPLPLDAVVETVTFDTGVAHVTGRVPPRDVPLSGP